MQPFIPLMVPDLQPQDIDAVVSVLQTGNLVQGQWVIELEKNIAATLGTKHAIAVSNGTASLHLALIALGIGPGDEVIVPALSYIATANVVELVGAKPVFVDIDIDTFNINTQRIEQAITPRTKAIMPVHEFGLACNIKDIKELAARHNLKIIEDAACALGATTNGDYAGSVGDVGSFSFHPRKAITSGEGGILITNDDGLDKKLRILRNHGVEYMEGRMEFTHAGFNYRMTDFQAALVNSQLPRLDGIIEKKNTLAQVYLRELRDCEKIQLPVVPANSLHTWQSFHVVLDDTINRDQLIIRMKDHGVGTNLGAQCMPSQKYFQSKYGLDSKKLFPNALRAFNQGLVLPLYQQLDEQQISGIASTLKNLIS